MASIAKLNHYSYKNPIVHPNIYMGAYHKIASLTHWRNQFSACLIPMTDSG